MKTGATAIKKAKGAVRLADSLHDLLKRLGVYRDGDTMQIKESDFVLWLLAQPESVREDVKNYAQQKHRFAGIVCTPEGYQRQLDSNDPCDRFLFGMQYLAHLRADRAFIKTVYGEWNKHRLSIDYRIRAESAAAVLGIAKRTFQLHRKDPTMDESTLLEIRIKDNARDVRFDGNEVLLLAIRREIQRQKAAPARM